VRSKPLPCPGPECGRPVTSFGFCEGHRSQSRRGLTLRPIGKTGHRPVERRPPPVLIADVVRESKTGKPLAQQAKALGLTGTRLQVLRTFARKEGHKIASGCQGAVSSPKWEELDRRTARCECGLLLPCASCTGKATDYMRSGRPAGGDSMWSTGGE
jgi:hypothetical protein